MYDLFLLAKGYCPVFIHHIMSVLSLNNGFPATPHILMNLHKTWIAVS